MAAFDLNPEKVRSSNDCDYVGSLILHKPEERIFTK